MEPGLQDQAGENMVRSSLAKLNPVQNRLASRVCSIARMVSRRRHGARRNRITGRAGYYTLAGDVNSEMVQRVFDAAARMSTDAVTTAHRLLQSHGGFIGDGICLYHDLANLPVRFITYNAGAVASIAVTVFLAGQQRRASPTARFMLHKSHASPPGARIICI